MGAMLLALVTLLIVGVIALKVVLGVFALGLKLAVIAVFGLGLLALLRQLFFRKA